MLNLRSTAARRLAKNSPLDYFCPATQSRSLCFSISVQEIPKQVRNDKLFHSKNAVHTSCFENLLAEG